MTRKKNETFKYLSGVCFVLTAVLEIAFFVQAAKVLGYFSMGIPAWIDVVGKVLVGVAVFIEVPTMVLAGSVVSLILMAMRMISGDVWIYDIFWTIFWAILAISCVSKKHNKLVCFAAGVVEIVHFVLTARQINIARLSFISIYRPLSVLLLALGAIFLGMEFSEKSGKRKQKSTAVKQLKVNMEDKLVRIEKLNGLLEKGYITKEEFGAKKKQIMKAETR